MNFDWISPVLAGVQNVARDGEVLLVPQNCGYTGREVEKVLRRSGCETWGLMAINDTFTVSVPKGQANAARDALARAGIRTGR